MQAKHITSVRMEHLNTSAFLLCIRLPTNMQSFVQAVARYKAGTVQPYKSALYRDAALIGISPGLKIPLRVPERLFHGKMKDTP